MFKVTHLEKTQKQEKIKAEREIKEEKRLHREELSKVREQQEKSRQVLVEDAAALARDRNDHQRLVDTERSFMRLHS